MSRLVLVRRRHRCLWTCPDRRRQVGEPSIRIPPPKPGPKPAIERRCLIRWQCAVRTAVPVSSRRQSEKKEKEFFFVCFTRARKKKSEGNWQNYSHLLHYRPIVIFGLAGQGEFILSFGRSFWISSSNLYV